MTGATPSSAGQPSRELAGHLGVEATARRVRHYRYAEERMMRVMAGWIALTPELPAKLLLGRQVWDCAQHADQWGKRLPELRAPAQVSEPPSPEFVRFFDALEGREAWGETLERLTGVYRVLKPHLIAVYDAHLGARESRVRAADPSDPRALPRRRAASPRGGGGGHRAACPHRGRPGARHRLGARAHGHARRLGRGGRERGVSPAGGGEGTEPERAARAHAGRIVGRDARAHEDLAPEAEITPPDLVEWLVAREFREFELVAHARIGAHHVFKTKFVGPTTLVVQARWAADADGRWRIREAEVTRVEGAPAGGPRPASRPGEV